MKELILVALVATLACFVNEMINVEKFERQEWDVRAYNAKRQAARSDAKMSMRDGRALQEAEYGLIND